MIYLLIIAPIVIVGIILLVSSEKVDKNSAKIRDIIRERKKEYQKR